MLYLKRIQGFWTELSPCTMYNGMETLPVQDQKGFRSKNQLEKMYQFFGIVVVLSSLIISRIGKR